MFGQKEVRISSAKFASVKRELGVRFKSQVCAVTFASCTQEGASNNVQSPLDALSLRCLLRREGIKFTCLGFGRLPISDE